MTYLTEAFFTFLPYSLLRLQCLLIHASASRRMSGCVPYKRPNEMSRNMGGNDGWWCMKGVDE